MLIDRLDKSRENILPHHHPLDKAGFDYCLAKEGVTGCRFGLFKAGSVTEQRQQTISFNETKHDRT
jgi:hypothetical protein